jgi:hypothetical protein
MMEKDFDGNTALDAAIALNAPVDLLVAMIKGIRMHNLNPEVKLVMM